jgi:hypothetical protein
MSPPSLPATLLKRGRSPRRLSRARAAARRASVPRPSPLASAWLTIVQLTHDGVEVKRVRLGVPDGTALRDLPAYYYPRAHYAVLTADGGFVSLARSHAFRAGDPPLTVYAVYPPRMRFF